MADKNTVEVLLRLKNQVSKELDKVNKSFKKTKASVDKTKKSFKGLGKESKKGLKDTSKFAKRTTSDLENLRKKSQGTQKGMGLLNATTVTLAATIYALSRAIRLVTSTFIDFDDTMRAVGAVSNATASQLDDLTNVARKMGATTRFTATQAADGLRFLAMAGFEVEQSIAALPGVLQLASAGALDLGQAADIATNILTGFGRAVDELGNVNDVLVTTFTSTNTNLIELGEAFKLVAPVASAVGSDFNDLSASLGLLANAGLKGTLAGTSLRGSIDALLNPTKEEAKFMEELSDRIGGVGLQVRNSEGNFVGFLSIIKQLEKAGLRGDEALKLFGLRAGPGIAALVNQGSDALEKLIVKLDESGGTAKRIATQMEAGLGGALRELNSAFTELILTIGEDFAPVLLSILKSLTGLIRAVAKVDTATKLLIGSFIALGSATLAWKLGLAKLGPALFTVLTNMEALRAVSLTVANIWKGALIGAIVFAAFEIGKVVTAMFQLNKAMKEQKQLMEEITDFWGDNTDALFIHIKTIEELKELSAEQLNEEKENLKSALKGWTLLLVEKRLNGKATDKEREKIKELKAAMDDFVKVAFDKPKKEMESLAQVTKRTGDAFKKAFKDTIQASDEYYSRAIYTAKEAALQGIISKEEEARRIIAIEVLKFDDMFRIGQEFAEKAQTLDKDTEANHAKSIELMKKSVEGLEKARLQSLAKYQQALEAVRASEQRGTDLNRELRQSITDSAIEELSGKDKVKALNKENKKDKKEIIKLTKEGSKVSLEAAEDIVKTISARNQQLKQLANDEDSSEKARKKAQKAYKKGQEELIKLNTKLAQERTLNAQTIADKYKQLSEAFSERLTEMQTKLDAFVSEERIVSIELEIDQPSYNSVQALIDAMEAKPIVKKVIFQTKGGVPSGAEEKAGGGPVGLATGGTVRGAGGVDNVPAWLTAGEFVIKKDSVEKLGLPFLHAMNNMSIDDMMSNARTQYATGGLVGGVSPLGQVSFSSLMKFANGGGVNDVAAEKERISREYDKQITEAKRRGDEDSVLVLEREKIAMRELANELEAQLAELNKLLESQVVEQQAIIEGLKKSKDEWIKAYDAYNNRPASTGVGSFSSSDPNIIKQFKGQGTAETFVSRTTNAASITQQNSAMITKRKNLVNSGISSDITDSEDNISRLEKIHSDATSKAKEENSLKEREIELKTGESLTSIERNTADEIRRLEEQKRDLLNGFNSSNTSSYLSGSGSRSQFFEDGGAVHGPGGVDNVPAYLSDGEHVITKSAVDMFGKPFFDRINSLRVPFPRFAEGGQVGSMPRESSSLKNLGTVNLNIGGKSFQVQGDQYELTEMINTLKLAEQRT